MRWAVGWCCVATAVLCWGCSWVLILVCASHRHARGVQVVKAADLQGMLVGLGRALAGWGGIPSEGLFLLCATFATWGSRGLAACSCTACWPRACCDSLANLPLLAAASFVQGKCGPYALLHDPRARGSAQPRRRICVGRPCGVWPHAPLDAMASCAQACAWRDRSCSFGAQARSSRASECSRRVPSVSV